MEPLLTTAETREAEASAIETFALPELLLMEHAALALVDVLEKRFGAWLPKTRGVIVAGAGNNGGDVCAAARILYQRGCRNLLVALVGAGAKATRSLSTQLEILGKLGVPLVSELETEWLSDADWVLDGIFGIGLSRPPDGSSRKAIEMLANTPGPRFVLAADVPSGLDANTGHPLGIAVRASATVTFGFVKRGLVTGAAADYVGQLKLDSLGIPRTVVPVSATTFWYGAADAKLPPRKPTSHKGDYGQVHVVLGDRSMHGAALLVALGALRSGAGRVSLIGEPAALEEARARAIPEIMTKPLEPSLLQSASATVVVGPGLGRSDSAKALVAMALAGSSPLVLDADALHLLEDGDLFDALVRRKAPTVLLPHPKEAAALLGTSVNDIESDRYASVEMLADKFRCAVLLKGRGTIIRGPKPPCFVVTTGTPALAKGGTGDLLAGVVAAFLAQGAVPERALASAAFVHGRAADRWSASGRAEESALPSELADLLGDDA